MPIKRLLFSFWLIAALFALPAQAIVWTEFGDAGDLPGTAQSTLPGGNITSITGELGFDQDTLLWDIDLFEIQIGLPTLFSARTHSDDDNVYVSDPVLFLFSLDGFGLMRNDDDSDNFTLQSRLPVGDPSAPTNPGRYLLGIAWSFSVPFDEFVQALFDDSGAGALDSWQPSGPPNFDLGRSYQILLTGIGNLVPEPSGIALLGVALAGLIFARRRINANL